MRFYTNVVRRGSNFLVREIRDGERILETIPYTPYLFLPTNEHTEYKNVHGGHVEKKTFNSIEEANGFLSQYRQWVFGMERWMYVFLNDYYPGQIEYDPSQILIAYLDIEVQSDKGFPTPQEAAGPVTAITFKVGDEIYAFGLGEYEPENKLVHYDRCKTEEHLLLHFLDKWQEVMPDVVTGWNILGFDIPYLVNRITNVLGAKYAKRLSPWELLSKRTIKSHGRETEISVPLGISILDYMSLYRKLVLDPRESYSLNHISSIELGESKLDYSQYESLTTLYKKNHDLFMQYNVRDVLLVESLEKRRHLIELTYEVSYDAKINHEDIFYSSRFWDARIHNYLMDRNVVVPTRIGQREEDRELVGGWVKEPTPKQYQWVVSVDVKSEYPSIIMQYNISPDTFIAKLDTEMTVDELLDGKLAYVRDQVNANKAVIAANLCMYDRERSGFLPVLLEEMFDKRQKFRQLELKAKANFEKTGDPKYQAEADRNGVMQSALKVSLNSGYGCLSNEYFRWYSINNAEAVTKTGQLTIRWAARAINQYLNRVVKTKDEDYVIGADTDSCYVNLEKLVLMAFENNLPDPNKVVDFIVDVCQEKLEPMLAKAFRELANYMNAKTNRIVMKREKICDKAILHAGKNYVLRVHETEHGRLKEPQIEVFGIKAVKPSFPEPSRKAFMTALKYILNADKDGLIGFVDKYREQFYKLKLEDISFPRSISGLDKYHDEDILCKPHCPIQVRGALVYNRMLQRHKDAGFPPIYDGDKAKYCYLKTPNPTGQDVISIVTALPKHFKLDGYVDHYTMFEKTFYEPLKTILDIVDWDIEQEGTLEGLGLW